MPNKKNSFKEFLDSHPITRAEAFRIARVHRTTFRRWLNGESDPPAATMELLRLHALKEPPSTHFEWHGWTFTQGRLFTPCNRGFTPQQVAEIPHLYRDRAILRELEQNYTMQHKLF